MAIGPVDLHRVVADELHIRDEDVGRDRVEIKPPNTGPLIDATGTVALPAEVSIRIHPDMALFPGNLQRSLLRKRTKIFGWLIHDLHPSILLSACSFLFFQMTIGRPRLQSFVLHWPSDREVVEALKLVILESHQVMDWVVK